MRKLNFRAWDTKSKSFTEFGPLYGLNDVIPKNRVSDSGYYIMESTGLLDKNGKEIFEGDIVKAASEGRHAICEIKWGKGRAGFFIYRKYGGIVWNLSGGGKNYDKETIEVIGNIYENPELLFGG